MFPMAKKFGNQTSVERISCMKNNVHQERNSPHVIPVNVPYWNKKTDKPLNKNSRLKLLKSCYSDQFTDT